MQSKTTQIRKRRLKLTKAPSRLSNAKLLKLAAKNPPPQHWFDETDVPFVPQKD